MPEFHTLRAVLGLSQLAIVAVLLHRDIGYLLRFGVLMFASAAMNLAPAHPTDSTWKYFVQVPAYAVILGMTLDATLELFAFLRRRSFIEERVALLTFAGIIGLIPIWVIWTWPGENWYQNAMLFRHYFLMWMAAGFLAAWCWLRIARPIHMSLQIADHGEFWATWLITSAALAGTTKYGALWKVAQWQGGETVWRVASDALILSQVCICCGFLFNCWSWKPDAAVQDALHGPQVPEPYRLRRPLHL